jgi:hypothetical protein
LEYASLITILPAEAENDIDPSAIHLGPQPEKGWCYYYEKADLARQYHDWEAVRDFGEEAIFNKKLQFFNDSELFPFILAYGLGGEWENALELLKRVVDYQVSEAGATDSELILSTWGYLDKRTPASAGKTRFLNFIESTVVNN